VGDNESKLVAENKDPRRHKLVLYVLLDVVDGHLDVRLEFVEDFVDDLHNSIFVHNSWNVVSLLKILRHCVVAADLTYRFRISKIVTL
jgi:hypothetical protein